jgi:PTH1 family peptidyl-tRNA hydrolase
VRLGIGHPGHKDAVAGFVLRDFAKADQDWLAALLTGIGNGAVHLAAGDGAKFMNAVALQTAPPRSSKSPKATAQKPAQTPAQTPAQQPATPAEGAPARSPLQKLLEKFK